MTDENTPFISPWYQEAFDRGFQKGFQEGLQERRRQLQREEWQNSLIMMLEYQFGPIVPQITERIKTFDMDQLEQLVRAVIRTKSLDEFLEHMPPYS